MGPAIAIIELHSIARGYLALDAMAKRAAVEVLHAEPISPGKFWIALEGGEAELEEALEAGVRVADESRLDHCLLPYAHEEVARALRAGPRRSAPAGAVGVLELDTLSSAVRAADAALKCAAVELVDLHLARGIGGKGYLVLCGSLADVDAALDAGIEAATPGRVVGRECIANPDEVIATLPPRRGSTR